MLAQTRLAAANTGGAVSVLTARGLAPWTASTLTTVTPDITEKTGASVLLLSLYGEDLKHGILAIAGSGVANLGVVAMGSISTSWLGDSTFVTKGQGLIQVSGTLSGGVAHVCLETTLSQHGHSRLCIAGISAVPFTTPRLIAVPIIISLMHMQLIML